VSISLMMILDGSLIYLTCHLCSEYLESLHWRKLLMMISEN